MTFLVLIIV